MGFCRNLQRKGGVFMYNPQITVEKIKEMRIVKGISLAELNEACGLNKNTITVSANSKTGLSAKILSDVSNFLGCSVDYLLGRTVEPTGICQIDTKKIGNNSNVNKSSFSDTDNELISEFKKLTFNDKVKVMSLIAELNEKNTKDE